VLIIYLSLRTGCQAREVIVKGGATNSRRHGGQFFGRRGVNTVKTLTFEKSARCMTYPAPKVAPPMAIETSLSIFARL